MKILFLPCLVLFFTGCAAAPAILMGENGVIRYQEFADGAKDPSFELAIVQENNNTFKEKVSKNSHVKRSTKNRYEILLENLVNDYDFLEAAASKEGLDHTRVISVENSRGKWVVKAPGRMDSCEQPYHPRFIKMVHQIMSCYDNIFTLTAVDEDKEFFMREKKRLEKITNVKQ